MKPYWGTLTWAQRASVLLQVHFPQVYSKSKTVSPAYYPSNLKELVLKTSLFPLTKTKRECFINSWRKLGLIVGLQLKKLYGLLFSSLFLARSSVSTYSCWDSPEECPGTLCSDSSDKGFHYLLPFFFNIFAFFLGSVSPSCELWDISLKE